MSLPSLNSRILHTGGIISIVIFTLSFALGSLLYKQYSEELNKYKLNSLLKSIEYAIREDLFNGNSYVAFDKIRNILSTENIGTVCLGIQDTATSHLKWFGPIEPCNSKKIDAYSTVYFDAAQTQAAFRINIKLVDPPFEKNIKITIVVWSFLIGLTCLLGILLIIKLVRESLKQINETIMTSAESKLSFSPKFIEISDLVQLKFEYLKNRSELEKNRIEIARADAILNITKQVAHDIRSPITALNFLTNLLSTLPEDKKILIRHSIQRINDIANDLLSKGKLSQQNANSDLGEDNTDQASCLIGVELESIVSEKRIQFKDKLSLQIVLEFFSNSYGVFANINNQKIRRVLSNLMNNAIEAFKENPAPKVTVKFFSTESSIKILIEDNGIGIPDHILQRLGERGLSYGKSNSESGSGLGIYHAKNTIESFGGILKIKSTLGVGTTVEIILKKSEAPSWFGKNLDLKNINQLVVIDDDQSIHALLKTRLIDLESQFSAKIEVNSFGSIKHFRSWFLTNKSKLQDALFFLDYEFTNDKESGLDFVEEFKIGHQSFLITSRYNEESIIARCLKCNVRQIPKPQLNLVPIIFQKNEERLDAVLIDDDSLQKMLWETAAKSKGKKVKVFSTESAFFEDLSKICKSTPIYIDVNLGNSVDGTKVARQIFDLGYKKIYLTTGFESEKFKDLYFISGVIHKEPPF